jgi:hypothetical protein
LATSSIGSATQSAPTVAPAFGISMSMATFVVLGGQSLEMSAEARQRLDIC